MWYKFVSQVLSKHTGKIWSTLFFSYIHWIWSVDLIRGPSQWTVLKNYQRHQLKIKTFLPRLHQGRNSNRKLLLARQPKITPNSYIPVIHYRVLEMRLINKNCIRLLTCATGRIHCTGAFFTRSRFKEKKFVNYL